MVVDVKNALDNLLSACRSVQPILLTIGEKRDIERMTVGEILNFINANFPCFSYSNQKQEPKRPFFCRGSCNFIIISILKMQ